MVTAAEAILFIGGSLMRKNKQTASHQGATFLCSCVQMATSLRKSWDQRTPSGAEEARKAVASFVQQREQVDYPGFVAAGMQIGSGLAESACKRFGTDRMKDPLCQ
jgi:hypothetical protein